MKTYLKWAVLPLLLFGAFTIEAQTTGRHAAKNNKVTCTVLRESFRCFRSAHNPR